MSDVAIGLAACGVSSVFFGSMFVPIKKFDSGDGMFTQWLMSLSILIIGFVAFAFSEFPGFYPLAMLGGAFWSLGNSSALPIISRLGMAVSILIWNTTNCLTGWATGRFGLFGMNAQAPASDLLNYAGLLCVIAGGFIFSQISSGTSEENIDLENATEDEKTALSMSPVKSTQSDQSKSSSRLTGIAMALIAGIFYGLTFVPVIHMIDNPETFIGYPEDGLSYVFSHYFGIFLTSTAIFVVYAIVKKNKPIINPEICLPSLAAGLLWGIAQTSFFIANEKLSQTVTFPIITMVPGCVASAWSILYFKEIQGRRNLTIFAVAMSITLCGSALVGLSKAVHL